MQLKSMTVANFRCYRSPITVTFDDITALVGRNDAGKSSLLDALDVFFNDKSLDKNDAAKESGGVVPDSQVPTQTSGRQGRHKTRRAANRYAKGKN